MPEPLLATEILVSARRWISAGNITFGFKFVVTVAIVDKDPLVGVCKGLKNVNRIANQVPRRDGLSI